MRLTYVALCFAVNGNTRPAEAVDKINKFIAETLDLEGCILARENWDSTHPEMIQIFADFPEMGNFRPHAVQLEEFVKNEFQTSLQGHWEEEDCSHSRLDIHDGVIDEQDLTWLVECPNHLIAQLREQAFQQKLK